MDHLCLRAQLFSKEFSTVPNPFVWSLTVSFWASWKLWKIFFPFEKIFLWYSFFLVEDKFKELALLVHKEEKEEADEEKNGEEEEQATGREGAEEGREEEEDNDEKDDKDDSEEEEEVRAMNLSLNICLVLG